MPDVPPTLPSDPIRGVFLGDLAHDLSTPLTAIHGAIELLLAGTYGPLVGEQRMLVQEVLASAREMRAIVHDVADLGALDTGRLVFAHTPVNVGGILEDIRTAMTDVAAKRGVSLALDAGTVQDATIDSDERRLRQILTCVFGYATKVARRGGRITATASLAGARLQVEVRATGVAPNGGPQALFSDRRDPTPGVPKPYRGPGLGLPLAARIVDAWGGRAAAEMIDDTLVLRVDLPAR